MKVWILIRDYGYEGHSPPDGIYSTEEKANEALDRLKRSETTSAELDIIEYEVDKE